MLQAPALFPLDQFPGNDHKPDDLYLFAFLLGGLAASKADVEKAIVASQPVCLIHLLPDAWVRPVNWLPVEKLALKSECGVPIRLEIGGQDSEHNFITDTIDLPPRQRMLVDKGFHSLAYLHAHSKPEARIGIHSPLHGEPYIIPAYSWGNLWIYGIDILFTGWLTHENFSRKAKLLSARTHTFQFDRTRVKNLVVPIGELNPLSGLLEKVRMGGGGKTRA